MDGAVSVGFLNPWNGGANMSVTIWDHSKITCSNNCQVVLEQTKVDNGH
jgi:hypothetical protein